ncbi:hypothetical protein EDD21DRAFT_449518 [Dissophora ornata]|nr:hypothetical protein EDD21DRAFT_449518 [Dissophora ornata]
MHDAVVLANCLFELKDLSTKSIGAAYRNYYTQRYPQARSQVLASRSITKLVCGQTLKERLSRYAILNWIPHSYQQRMVLEALTYRPQASFLSPAEDRGTDQTLSLSQIAQRQWTEDEVLKRVQAVWRKSKMAT